MTVRQPQRQPLYDQIRQLLLRRIAEGEWRAHEALPSEWDLAAELDVSQGTVRKALTALVADGLLYRQQGKGTFVAEVPSDWGGARLQTPGLFGEPPDELLAELLGVSRVNASDDVASALHIRRGAPLLRVRQLWRYRGEAVALDDAYLPAEQFEGVDARSLRGMPGVYAVLQQRFGVRLRVMGEQFRAQLLPREEAVLLGVTGAVAEGPVLALVRLSESLDGQPLEWRQRYCLTHALAYGQ